MKTKFTDDELKALLLAVDITWSSISGDWMQLEGATGSIEEKAEACLDADRWRTYVLPCVKDKDCFTIKAVEKILEQDWKDVVKTYKRALKLRG
jgi:hypothetical protein